MTVPLCVQLASALNYKYAGLQYATQCFLGDKLDGYTSPGECDMQCSGSSDMCGGACTGSIYNIPFPEGPGPRNTDSLYACACI